MAVLLLVSWLASSSPVHSSKRLEANISLLAPTLLLEFSVCLMPKSVVIYSAGLLPFDVHCLKMGDEFSHFIFSGFDA